MALQKQFNQANVDHEKAVNEINTEFTMKERGMLAEIDRLANYNQFLLERS